MKKSLKISLIVISIIVLIGLIGIVWWKDNNKIIEKPSEKVIEIAKSIDGEATHGGPYAYSIEKDTDKITLTYYTLGDTPRIILMFYIEDGIVSKIYKELHYTTKLQAKWYAYDENIEVTDKKVNGNVVTGWIEAFGIGQTADEVYNNLINDTNLVRIHEE